MRRVRRVINHYKMAKHFHLTITDQAFPFSRNQDAVTAEGALDRDDVVLHYKGLEDVERLAKPTDVV